MQEQASPPDALSILDVAEDDGACQRVEKHQKKHAEDDEETLADADADGQHQHLERGVLARYGEEAQNHHHEAHEVREVVLWREKIIKRLFQKNFLIKKVLPKIQTFDGRNRPLFQ